MDKKQRMLIRFEVLAAFFGGMGFGGYVLGKSDLGVILSVFLISLTLLFKSFIHSKWKEFFSEEDEVMTHRR
jgi:hypothetical protein